MARILELKDDLRDAETTLDTHPYYTREGMDDKPVRPTASSGQPPGTHGVASRVPSPLPDGRTNLEMLGLQPASKQEMRKDLIAVSVRHRIGYGLLELLKVAARGVRSIGRVAADAIADCFPPYGAK